MRERNKNKASGGGGIGGELNSGMGRTRDKRKKRKKGNYWQVPTSGFAPVKVYEVKYAASEYTMVTSG